MPFTCSICGEESFRICARCTKDACNNHICDRCKRCSDCCECEVLLDEPRPVLPVEVPVEQTPVEETPVVETPIDEPPVEETVPAGDPAPEETIPAGDPPAEPAEEPVPEEANVAPADQHEVVELIP